jgi:hypothetical protein
MKPGAPALTLMPSRPTSRARTRHADQRGLDRGIGGNPAMATLTPSLDGTSADFPATPAPLVSVVRNDATGGTASRAPMAECNAFQEMLVDRAALGALH